MSLDHGQESCSGTHKTSLWWLTPHSWASLADSFTDAPVMVDVNSDIVDLDNDYDGTSRWNVDGNWLQVSSIYNLHLASRCYSKGKGDKSHRMRCTTTLKGGDTSPMWRRTSPTGEEFSTWGKRKEDVEGEGFSFSLCAAPLDRLSPHISEEWSCDRGAGAGVGVELEEELIVMQKQDEDRALLIFVLRYKEIHRDLYTNWKDRILVINTRHVKDRVGETHERRKHMKGVNTWKE